MRSKLVHRNHDNLVSKRELPQGHVLWRYPVKHSVCCPLWRARNSLRRAR